MSNHITAAESKLILLEYANGVKTLVPTFDWLPEAIKEAIQKAINYFVEEFDPDSSCGVVWNIDSMLNSRFSLAQSLFNGEIRNKVEYIGIPYYYDLGENETEEEIREVFPDYEYKDNAVWFSDAASFDSLKKDLLNKKGCAIFDHCDGICQYCDKKRQPIN